MTEDLEIQARALLDVSAEVVRMTRLKEIAVVLGVTSVLAGCLFPSFDNLGGAQTVDLTSDAGLADVKADTATGDDASKTKGEQPPATTPLEGGTAPPLTIACGTAGQCDLSIEYCCFTVGGPDCQPHGAAGMCSFQGSGELLSCDGAEDCTGGNVCCYVAGEKKALCKSATACSNGKVLCNGPQRLCGAGQGECNGNVSIGSNNYRVCQ